MKKQFKIAFAMFACAVLMFAFAGVYATEPVEDTEATVVIKEVASESELLAALEDTSVQVIRLTKDITTTAKVNITRNVIIEGNSHTITLGIEDKTVWGGHYVLQAYRCDVILNNISLTGGNAGLLVNGGNVTVEGNLDVSGNGFGGIEVAKSGDNMPSLDLTNATLKNTSEAYLLPTIWEDPALEDAIVIEGEDYLELISVAAANGNEQYQYYLDESNTLDTPDNQLKNQLDNGYEEIEIDAYKTNEPLSKELLNELKAGDEKTVTIFSEDYMMVFNTKNITEEFTKDLSLNITVGEEQTFESDILKDVKEDMIFIDLEYSGVLPKGTTITIRADDFGYTEGDKFMVYYYNPTTDGMELISEEVVVDNNDWATITIDHASTYVLSTGALPVKTAGTTDNTNTNTGITNPNTSDMTMFVAMTLGVLAVAGFGYVAKVKISNK